MAAPGGPPIGRRFRSKASTRPPATWNRHRRPQLGVTSWDRRHGAGRPFPVRLIFLVRRHLIHPLQRIDHALSNFSADQPAPRFDTSRMLEIQAVEEGIREHHAPVAAERREPPGTQRWPTRDGLTGLMNCRHFHADGRTGIAAGAALSPAGHRGHGRPDYFKGSTTPTAMLPVTPCCAPCRAGGKPCASPIWFAAGWRRGVRLPVSPRSAG